jgi:homocysteine S-methyltransferase
MGVPMDPVAWCGPANYTHPSSVVQVHERHIRAGADIITTNTWSTVRPTLERAGYGAMVREINARAVHLAQEARDRAAGDRPVYIAGSISSNITGRDPRTGEIGFGAYFDSPRVPADELEDYYREMTGILAEAGVDFFLVEPMGRDNEARVIEAQAAKDTGLPVWVGFDAHVSSDDNVILGGPQRRSGSEGAVPAGARPINENMTLAEAIAEVKPVGPDVMAVFHSRIKNMNASLRVMLDVWTGPVMAYPDSGRAGAGNRTVVNEESTSEFTDAAKEWADMGVQVVGACCGFGSEYVEPLRQALPGKIAQPRGA